MIDLHTHTRASDGSFTLSELVKEANRVGLNAIAITDHDTVESTAKLASLSKKSKTQLIPGIELTVFDGNLEYSDLHIVGLFIDPKNRQLHSRLNSLQVERENQKKATVSRLNELGYSITFAEVKKKASGCVGRPHIAKVLLENYPDDFSSIADIFSKLLARGKKAYVEREVGLGLSEAISLIKSAGGLSFIAHPFVYPYDPGELAEDFSSLGGDGIEVYYDYITNRPEVKISKQDNERLISESKALADSFDLLYSGGSDFHGESKGQKMGVFGAPDSVLYSLSKGKIEKHL